MHERDTFDLTFAYFIKTSDDAFSINHYIFNIYIIFVISRIQYDMNRNRVSDDANHVNDESIVIKSSKKSSSELWLMSQFKSFFIKNDLQHELDKLFQHISRTLYDIFSLFFTKEILQKLINYINQYVDDFDIDHIDKSYARTWFFIIVKKLRVYITTFIYMSLHLETCIEDFWNTMLTKVIHLFVSLHIFLKRWQQINRFFHFAFINTVHRDVFEKIDELFEHFRITFKKYWIIDTHLIVDEIIERFMSRFFIIVNISFKSKFEEYKIWILANDDYVLNWLYHVKNDRKSMNLNIVYIKKWNYSKIQIVVFDLLQQKNIFDDYSCVVWMNNLFTSTDVIVTCFNIDFEAVDTVRIIKTKRKEQKEIKDIKTQKKRKEFNRDLNSILFDLKLKHEARIEWDTMYEKIINNVNVLQFAWKNQQMILFMTSIDID